MVESHDFLNNIVSSDALGILLGYGKINAQGFHKRLNLSVAINMQSSPPFKEDLDALNRKSLLFVKGYSPKWFKSDPAFSSSNLSDLIEELNSLAESLKFFEFSKPIFF